MEGLEEEREFVRANTGTGIDDIEAEEGAIAFDVAFDAEGDLAVLGEFGGVGKEIEEALAEFDGVGEHPIDSGGEGDVQGVAVFGCGGADEFDDFGEKFGDLESGRVDVDFAGFDLRHFKDGVDEVEKMFAGGFDFLEVLEVAVAVVGFGLFLEHLAVADDGVERSAKLMRHGGEEGAFDGAGVFGGAAAGSDALIFDGEENEETGAAEDGEGGGHFHVEKGFLGEPLAFFESGVFDFADDFVEVGVGLEFTSLFHEFGGEVPFAEPAGLVGGAEFGHFPVGEFFNFRKAGADRAMGLAHFAEFRQLSVEAIHRAGVGGEEFGLAGEEEGAGTGFGAGESELELANEADGATILAGEEVGLNAFLPIEIDGSDAE